MGEDVSVGAIAGVIAIGLTLWRTSSRWTRLEERLDVLWAERAERGRAGLKERGVLVENSPLSLGEAVGEAMAKHIAPDMLDFFREQSGKRRLPKHDADIWVRIVKRFGTRRLMERAAELGWSIEEYEQWWVAGIRNPHLVESVLKKGGL